MGVYTAELRLSTATSGVEDIIIPLRAEAVPMGTFPDPYQPIFSVSTKKLNLVLNPDNNYSDLQGFTFSASNLQKTLYCKWAHTSNVLFQYEYQNQYMEILASDYELELNGSAHFPAGYDYIDEEVLVAVGGGLTSAGNYTTRLHFYSYKKDSKTELAIDEYVTITTQVTHTSVSTDLDELQSSQTQATKILRDGQLLILRNGQSYTITGRRIVNNE